MMRRVALWVAGALLAAACGNADASPPSTALERHAAPLVEAHDALDEQAALVEAAPDEATAAWPAVEAQVRTAVEAVGDPDGLGLEARERSTLVGYGRGLEVALGEWAAVHAALADGDVAAAERAADRARDRMRHLEPLRAATTR